MKRTSLKGFVGKCLENPWKEQKRFAMEVMEIQEIAEKLVARIERKIETLKSIEAQADEKIALLDGLISRWKRLQGGIPGKGEERGKDYNRDEVLALARKGFDAEQISRILDLPRGEVELILNLVH